MGYGSEVYFKTTRLTDLKAAPSPYADTERMLKESTLLLLKSMLTDSLGTEWYQVRLQHNNIEGFVLSDAVELMADGEGSKDLLELSTLEAEDKKRRLTLLRSHRDWPRRIQSAVRKGAICLTMTTEQLIASWQEPASRTSGFIIGSGDVAIFFYRPDNPVAVVLKDGRVIGWSEKR